jgi:hypothetical protein
MDAAVTPWREAALTFTRAFFDRRLARERAIAAKILAAPRATVQAGLFDRRAEHDRLAKEAAVSDAVRDARRRIAVIENASTMCPRPARLLLVLAP